MSDTLMPWSVVSLENPVVEELRSKPLRFRNPFDLDRHRVHGLLKLVDLRRVVWQCRSLRLPDPAAKSAPHNPDTQQREDGYGECAIHRIFGDAPHLPKPPRSRWLKALALLVIASGLGLAVFTAWAWGPMHEDEWPGFVPIIVGTGSLLLIWWGAGLWTGTWSGWWPGGPDG